MAQGYELLVIMHPDVSDEHIQGLSEKIKNIIEQTKGDFLKTKAWGKRRLVYKIKGFLRGYFLLIYFNGNPSTLKQVDVLLRYNEQVLRYQTVRIEKEFDVQSLPEQALGEAEGEEDIEDDDVFRGKEKSAEGAAEGSGKEVTQ